MKDYNDPEDFYEKVTDGVGEIDGTDIKINPDYYIHKAIVKAIDALSKENIREAFLMYRMAVETVETMCRATNKLPDNYADEIKKFLESDQYKAESDVSTKQTKLANKKFELLLSEVFQNKTINAPLKLP